MGGVIWIVGVLGEDRWVTEGGRREMGGSNVWTWLMVGKAMRIAGSAGGVGGAGDADCSGCSGCAGGAGGAGWEGEWDSGWAAVGFDGLFLERFFGGATGEKRHISKRRMDIVEGW